MNFLQKLTPQSKKKGKTSWKLNGVNIRRALEIFYERYNPGRVNHIDSILSEYIGNEEVMLKMICERYSVSSSEMQKILNMANPTPVSPSPARTVRRKPDNEDAQSTTESIGVKGSLSTSTRRARPPPPRTPLKSSASSPSPRVQPITHPHEVRYVDSTVKTIALSSNSNIPDSNSSTLKQNLLSNDINMSFVSPEAEKDVSGSISDNNFQDSPKTTTPITIPSVVPPLSIRHKSILTQGSLEYKDNRSNNPIANSYSGDAVVNKFSSSTSLSDGNAANMSKKSEINEDKMEIERLRKSQEEYAKALSSLQERLNNVEKDRSEMLMLVKGLIQTPHGVTRSVNDSSSDMSQVYEAMRKLNFSNSMSGTSSSAPQGIPMVARSDSLMSDHSNSSTVHSNPRIQPNLEFRTFSASLDNLMEGNDDNSSLSTLSRSRSGISPSPLGRSRTPSSSSSSALGYLASSASLNRNSCLDSPPLSRSSSRDRSYALSLHETKSFHDQHTVVEANLNLPNHRAYTESFKHRVSNSLASHAMNSRDFTELSLTSGGMISPRKSARKSPGSEEKNRFLHINTQVHASQLSSPSSRRDSAHAQIVSTVAPPGYSMMTDTSSYMTPRKFSALGIDSSPRDEMSSPGWKKGDNDSVSTSHHRLSSSSSTTSCSLPLSTSKRAVSATRFLHSPSPNIDPKEVIQRALTSVDDSSLASPSQLLSDQYSMIKQLYKSKRDQEDLTQQVLKNNLELIEKSTKDEIRTANREELDDWTPYVDKKSGKIYYYSTSRKRSTWKLPGNASDEDWQQTVDPKTKRVYWYNKKTRSSSWTAPKI